jgi:hypothetical protein
MISELNLEINAFVTQVFLMVLVLFASVIINSLNILRMPSFL